MGLLLLISPPGYGKTTLLEYVANRLGITMVKINGPALGPGEWPADKITDYHSRGYRITGVSGHSSDRWVVVVSTGTSLGEQKWIHSATFPENWLRTQWGLPATTNNNSVEELAMEEVK